MAGTQPQFRAFTTQHAGRVNRVFSKVLVSSAFDPANPPETRPEAIEVSGLWDTGASQSCLDQSIVDRLMLPPMGKVEVNVAGANGRSEHLTHVVNITLPNEVEVCTVLVTGGHSLGPDRMLIGMDIIGLGDFALTHANGITRLSFRIPAAEHPIDYVKDWRQVAYRGVGRNDPCPCGKQAGTRPVKFKDCCLRSTTPR